MHILSWRKLLLAVLPSATNLQRKLEGRRLVRGRRKSVLQVSQTMPHFGEFEEKAFLRRHPVKTGKRGRLRKSKNAAFESSFARKKKTKLIDDNISPGFSLSIQPRPPAASASPSTTVFQPASFIKRVMAEHRDRRQLQAAQPHASLPGPSWPRSTT